MTTLKENLIKEIQQIDDERILKSVQSLIHSVREVTGCIEVNSQQKTAFEEARAEYKKGNFHSTDDLFNELLDE